jgi:pimeloyl-ACP methyl ester carboxylesterase/spore coat polysaccharide biosynthesis predicted glycosyltransferase SpsG
MATVQRTTEQREQTRARYPDADGFIERDGVRVFWERYGAGEQTILLLPTWEIVHSRAWKLQIPYLARDFQVVTFDPRGNGRSDRPSDPAAYDRREFAADAIAILDALGVARAAVVSWCGGVGVLLAAEHPERVTALVEIATDLPVTPEPSDEQGHSFDEPLTTDEEWAKWNRHFWLRDWPGFVEFFMSEIFSEPHSTKQIEDAVGWGLETDPNTIVRGISVGGFDPEQALRLCAEVRCPVLVVQGMEDGIVGADRGPAIAAAIPGARLWRLNGSGHAPHLRDPVRFNLELRSFLAEPPAAPREWRRACTRPKRALYVSSPIGLGHARRDVAIARELRKLHPDLEIDWLAQDPVTRVLEECGERIHPASAELANESHHIACESAGHDLHCFQAIRRMDEILLANFMVFHDVVSAGSYDLWIGDEAWDVDYYLHENPELKTARYCWLTDFVGWLPMPDGGDREAFLTADYNAEMIEHIARYPRVRDRSIFIGNPDDIVPGTFGPGLPGIRDWTEEHYDFAGYVTGFDVAALPGREALRAEFGYRPDEQICIVTVGGSGVGSALVERVARSFDEARRLVPGLRMILVTGPRIDPGTVPLRDGLEVHAYVHDLYRRLAACDLAVVQGGLTTSMELTAAGTPFLYFPLRGHFEQNYHVRHRLDRHRAGRCMDFETATPAVIAAAIAEEIGRDVDYRPVETDGAARAAGLIADLI